MTVGQLVEILKTYPVYFEILIPNGAEDIFAIAEEVNSGKYVPWYEEAFGGRMGEVVSAKNQDKNCLVISRKFE